MKQKLTVDFYDVNWYYTNYSAWLLYEMELLSPHMEFQFSSLCTTVSIITSQTFIIIILNKKFY